MVKNVQTTIQKEWPAPPGSEHANVGAESGFPLGDALAHFYSEMQECYQLYDRRVTELGEQVSLGDEPWPEGSKTRPIMTQEEWELCGPKMVDDETKYRECLGSPKYAVRQRATNALLTRMQTWEGSLLVPKIEKLLEENKKEREVAGRLTKLTSTPIFLLTKCVHRANCCATQNVHQFVLGQAPSANCQPPSQPPRIKVTRP